MVDDHGSTREWHVSGRLVRKPKKIAKEPPQKESDMESEAVSPTASTVGRHSPFSRSGADEGIW